MKTHLLVVILAIGACQCQNDKCSLSSEVENKPFPNMFIEYKIDYQMTVEYTLPGAGESIYYTEYYDINEKKGRLDIQEEGESSKYYYYGDTSEAFEVRGETCKIGNISGIPEYMRSAPYGWTFTESDRIMHGPSAMFRHAFVLYSKNPASVVYMGKAETAVRGFNTVYWKRCIKDTLTAEYHFMSDEYYEASGLLHLKDVPLRVYIYGKDAAVEAKLLPQNFEFLSFMSSTPNGIFDLPAGYGCTEYRENNEDDFPDIPNFSNKNLMIYGETVYTDKTTEIAQTYLSTFMLAIDLASEHMAYEYTPWVQSSDANGKEAAPPIRSIVDMKNHYVYMRNYSTDSCLIMTTRQFPPRYFFPNSDDTYVDLTDPAVLFQNNEFVYLGEGEERGLKVNIFETVFPNYYLNEVKFVSEAIVTHYYLKPDEILVGQNSVSEALIKIQIRLNSISGSGSSAVKKPVGELIFNFFEFSTQIEKKTTIFDIRSCLKNSDDAMWITVGFEAEQAQIQKLKKLGPIIEENVISSLETSTEITPIRSPHVSIGFLSDSVMASILILQRPPTELDFQDVSLGKTIVETTEMEGIMSPEGCANKCLEEDTLCWGYAICGATCYIGVEGSGKIQDKQDCILSLRTNNATVFTMQKIALSVQEEIQSKRLRLMIPINGEEPIELVANFYEEFSPGISDDLFDLMGKELNPRLRVLKVASKLSSSSGVSEKNFGQLSYGECQRLCLDYRECESVSYCLGSQFDCVLSKTFGEDIPDSQIKEDAYCNILTRKYSDKFTQSPGNVLSQTALKVVKVKKDEECARACIKEPTFKCLSFDHCSTSKDAPCRLHGVHFLDEKPKEDSVTKDSVCGHYSRKFSNDFKVEPNSRALGTGFLLSNDMTLEECSKGCVEYNGSDCSAFDFCEDLAVTKTACYVITAKLYEMKTGHSPICSHYIKENATIPVATVTPPANFSSGTTGGLGFLFFLIGGVLGALIVFGIAYYRINK